MIRIKDHEKVHPYSAGLRSKTHEQSLISRSEGSRRIRLLEDPRISQSKKNQPV